MSPPSSLLTRVPWHLTIRAAVREDRLPVFSAVGDALIDVHTQLLTSMCVCSSQASASLHSVSILPIAALLQSHLFSPNVCYCRAVVCYCPGLACATTDGTMPCAPMVHAPSIYLVFMPSRRISLSLVPRPTRPRAQL
eukprot:1955851-Rhodomonas_salina.1